MTTQSESQYDVFISYSRADREWVVEQLLPRLEQAGLRVTVDYRDFVVGMPRIENIELAVESSRRTVVVLTPDWLDSEWNSFEALLVRTADPAARQRKLLPVLLKSVELPDLIDSLEKADLTVERHWEKQIGRLIRDIEDVIPVPPPWQEGGIHDFTQWKRWLRRYRRELRRGAVAVFALWLLSSLILQLTPFQPREAWASLGIKAPEATQLARTGNVLLIGGNNVEHGCDKVQQGLWRSPDMGEHWEVVHAPLDFKDPDRGCLLADITGFAVSPAIPDRVYAATSDVGLLRSDDAGRTWQRTGDTDLPSTRLVAVTVDPSYADRVFIALQDGGLFRSDDGGEQWQRLDRQESEVACEQGEPLTGTLAVGTLLATPGHLIVGTGDPFYFTDVHVPSGLYTSTNGGRCWQQVDDGRGRDEYRALAFAPTPAADHALLVVRDWGREPDENPVAVWRLDLTLAAPKRQLLWAQRSAIASIGVQGESWYIATPLGKVLQGTLDVPARTQELPRLAPCFALVCDVALVSDRDRGPPLLLAGGRVFRLQRGPWWRRVWP